MSFDLLVAAQAGVVTRRQALACGLSSRTVQRRVHRGAWRALHPSVYLVGGHRVTDEVRVRAAVLWAGDGAHLAGPAAAYWHGMLSAAPAIVEVRVPAARKPRARPGVRVRRRDLDPCDRVLIRDVAVTAAALTVLETAVVLADGPTFLDRALQRHVRFPALYRCYCRNLGARGSARAAGLLVTAADRADSGAERLLVRLLRAAGVTGWVLGYAFGPYLIDLAFVVRRVAVEVDGWAWHVDVERFRADRRKGNVLVGAGWHVLRFTWHDLTGRPEACVAEIRKALTRAA